MPINVLTKNAQRRALVAGFWKGLGAASVVSGRSAASFEEGDFEPRPLPMRALGDISQDWQVAGDDLRSAIAPQSKVGVCQSGWNPGPLRKI